MIGLASLLSLALAAPHVSGADTTVVRGTVFDSIAARRIAGASVQLARADSGHTTERFSASTDAGGSFSIPGVPAGRYLVAFYHPMLDSLGLELPDRVIDISSSNATIRLATPSPATMIRAFCGDSLAAASPTLLFGHVHDTRTESGVENAHVTVTWAAAEQTAGALAVVDRTGQTTTHRAGLFALCGVPSDVPLSVRVARANDSAVVNVRVPPSGILHLTMSVSSAGASGRVVGHVVDGAKRAVAGAQVAIGDHGVAVNDAGAFALDNVPTGSQSVDVRAIGYAPASVLVDVAEGRATNVDVSLERVTTLPGVVTRDSAQSEHLAEFLHDKRSVTVAARFVEQTRIPGYKAGLSVCQLVTKASGYNFCSTSGVVYYCPTMVVNGTWTSLRMGDIDPDDIIGVEYFSGHVPSKYETQFAMRPKPCPFIVWTRCPGAAIPTCGDNPESNPLNRPPDDDETIVRRRR